MNLTIRLHYHRDNFELDIDTTLPTQGFNAIYGHSGSGKTTLLRCLAGLEKKVKGSVYFNQHCWQSEQHFEPTQHREVAYVFQDARLFPHLTVLGNLHYAYKRRFNNNGASIEQVCEWFELQPLLTQAAPSLSSGQKQRVAMARALLSSPKLILMDEPLGSLDHQSKQKILRHLQTLRNTLQTPVVYVSHDFDEVSRLADQLILLKQGKILEQGPLLSLCARIDLSLNHEENAASIIEATVLQHDDHYHLTQLAIGDSASEKQTLFLTKNSSQPGQTIRIRIPARDVSLTLQKASDSSILNILQCTIDAIEETSNACILIRLKLANQYLLARLTYKSVDRLQLTIGQTVFAQIKTVALLSEQIDC